MFLNERNIPLTLQQIIVVRSRLEKYHSKQRILEKSELKRWAGYHGERTVDKYLERFAADKLIVFRDLNLEEKEPFQIDTFLYNQFFGLILEIKNILGTLYFDKYSNQMIRTWKGEREGFTNPILQAQMHQYHFQNWLAQHKLPPMPILWLVVFSNPATILETTPGNEQIFQKVIHTHLLQIKINQLLEKYSNSKLNNSTMKELTQCLLEERPPRLTNILQKYEIPKSDIKPGTRCPNCNHVPMMRVSATWLCPICKFSSRNAHMPSLYDFVLMNQPTITNSQCRDFLQLSSRSIAQGILSELPMVGTKRSSIYQLTDLLHHPDDYFLLPKNKQWDNS